MKQISIEDFKQKVKLINKKYGIKPKKNKKPAKKKKIKCSKNELTIINNNGHRCIFKNGKQLSYSEYLKTRHWSKTRKRILKKYNFVCYDCLEKAVDVHHLTYERIGNERDSDLIPICIKCHSIRHDK